MNTQAAFLAAAIVQPLLIVDQQLHCVVGNPPFCGWFGGKPDQYDGVPLDQIAGGAFSAPDLLAELQAALGSQNPCGGHTVHAGDTALSMRACPVVLQGDPALLIFFEQPPSAPPVRASGGELELLWTLLGEGPYLLFEMDGNGMVQRLSAGFERLTGWSPDYWLGRSGQGLVHPDDVVSLFSPQVAFAGDTWLNVVRVVTKTGEYRRFEVCTYPLLGPNGNLDRVIGIGRDLTEYFILLDRRKDAESEARALFAAMHDIVLVASRKGHIMRVLSFPEGILPWRGDPNAPIGGVKVEDVLWPVINAEGIAHLESAIATGRPLRHEFEYGADEGQRWFSATYSPLDDERVLIVAHDITDRKHAEQRAIELALARQRTGVLERLIADVSHDLRNPITVQRSSAFLLDEYLGQLYRQINELYEHTAAGRMSAIRSQTVNFGQILADMREQVTRLDTSLQRIQSSVESRLYEVRAEHGVGFEFHAEPLEKLIEQVIAIRRADAARRGQSLSLALDESVPPVVVDPGELGRALRILVGRVLQDAPDNAAVTVSARRDDAAVVVEVSGPVSADPFELARLSDPAYRAARMGDQWQSSHDLTIAHHIVLAHGGKVGQETRPGSVRVWQVWLPLGAEPEDDAPDGMGAA